MIETVPTSAFADSADIPGGDLVVTGVSKRFGGVPALTDISLTIKPGEVHAFVGENGAGKSTLAKIISGVYTPDEGSITLGGRSLALRSPREAIANGIITIAQELAIVPGLSVAENVYLGSEIASGGFLKKAEARRRFQELAERSGFQLSPDAPAGSLSTADQQKVEIMRAVSRNASIVVMDEPSAALSSHESAALHDIIRSLTARGSAVILISHFLSEVLSLADTITTLRDGRLISTVPSAGATQESIIEGMLGRSLAAAYPEKIPASPDAPVVLDVSHLCAAGVDDCTFQVRRGEILGIAGLVGAGRSELVRAVFRDAKVTSGTVRINDYELTSRHPQESIERGLVLIPESRKQMGLLMERSVKENISLARLDLVGRFGWLSKLRERKLVSSLMAQSTVKGATLPTPAMMVSGGNQQKLLFARSIMCAPSVLIADEPTRGVDVGSKRAIYDLMVQMAAEGMAIIVISSELDEVLGLAHRILVMRQGHFTAELVGDEMNEQNVLAAAFSEARMG
jgi:simple sugar transport system ATP-binding protein/ribose transport system ATP-binding protein